MAALKEFLKAMEDDDGSVVEKRREIERLRQQGMSRVNAMIASAPNVFTRRDAQIYMEDFSEAGMRKWGYVTEDDQLKSLKELLQSNLPEMERRAPSVERKFRSKIENAIANKWIGRRSAARWMQRLAAENAYYWQKENFIETKFGSYLSNWERVAKERQKLLGSPLVKALTAKDVSNLSVFLNEDQFLNRPYEERQNLVAAVQGALAAKEKQMPALHAQAKAMLQAAVHSKALSPSKVGVWMSRIFKSGAKAETIENFLNNKGPMPLQRLIANWQQASNHFHELENKRKDLGTPRGFHFVNLTVFLNWDYERRRAYIQEANNRFKALPKADVLVKIRHELDTKDWDSADALIKQARGENLSDEDQKQLQSLEKYLREHRKNSPGGAEKQNPSPEEVIRKLDACLGQVPTQLQKIYKRALSRGYQAFWATTVLMYNRVWCHQHGFYDSGKEQVMEKQAKDPTRDRMREGHTKDQHEVNVVKGDTNSRSAIRDQAGIRKAQILFTDERSEETLVTEIDEQKNDRNFWYWTSMIPQGVSYADHLYVVMAVHPQMKKLARQLESMGIRYPLSGGDGAMAAATRNARTAKPSKN